MAEIVELQSFQRVKPRLSARTGDAEIVIFPGVRIDRRGINLADRLMHPHRKATRSARRSASQDD